jgi:hypothetical protein
MVAGEVSFDPPIQSLILSSGLLKKAPDRRKAGNFVSRPNET